MPNVSAALSILLMLPVSVASSENSFLKLKLTKTYMLYSAGKETNVVGSATISIEHARASTFDRVKLDTKNICYGKNTQNENLMYLKLKFL